MWRAGFDPGVLCVRAEPVAGGDDAFVLARFARWATAVPGRGCSEHIALSDGWRRIRLDVVEGSLAGQAPVRLHYLLSGFDDVEPRLLTLQRLLALWQHGAFVQTLFAVDTAMPRRIEALRVGDALAAGASYREMAGVLYGEARARAEWRAHSDFLFSRVRRLAIEARRMAGGGWRRLLDRGGRRAGV